MGFDYVIVTAPNESLCEIYQTQLNYLCHTRKSYPKTTCLCIADPSGVRIGSGGGTLNALSRLIDSVGLINVKHAKIAIIHSGGDSRRSPLQSVAGKAWTHINSSLAVAEGEDYPSSPLSLLWKELEIIEERMNGGSLVVASSDVLVHLTSSSSSDNKTFPPFPNGVTIITVPECLNTARNHGVVSGHSCSSETQLFRAKTYLQKPKIEEMNFNNTIIHSTTDTTHDCQREDCHTLIDTGIVVVSGDAFEAFLNLLEDSSVKLCTEKGISTNLHSALRLELYSDILHAFSLESGETSFENYLSRLGVQSNYSATISTTTTTNMNHTPYELALYQIWSLLKSIPLYGIYIPNGIFYHLGTSLEYLNLVTSPIHNVLENSLSSSTSLSQSKKLSALCIKYHLQNNINSKLFSYSNDFTTGDQISKGTNIFQSLDWNSLSIISINSCLCFSTTSSIGKQIIFDNSVIYGDCSIGDQCIISNLSESFGRSLTIPPRTMIQQIPLSSNANKFILIALGLQDDIKATVDSTEFTLCGATLAELLEGGKKIQINDLWDEGESERSLWTAKLFPIIEYNQNEYFLGRTKIPVSEIIQSCCWFLTPQASNSTTLVWKEFERLSLRDILRDGDGAELLRERLYRSTLCRQISISSTSPIRAIADWSFIYHSIWDTILTIRSALFEGDPSMSMTTSSAHSSLSNSQCFSLFLSLSLTRLCLRNSTLSEIQPLLKNVFPSAATSSIDTLIISFNQTWDLLKSRNLVLVANSYMTQLLHYFPSNHCLLDILKLALPFICFTEYPRFLLLLDWLLENNLVTLAGNGPSLQDISVRNSPEMLFQTLQLLKINVGHFVESEEDHSLVKLAQATIRHQLELNYASQMQLLDQDHHIPLPISVSQMRGFSPKISFATSPVRIDLAGGWSDTPPISYEYPGSVVNVAINLDGIPPLWCKCFFIEERHLSLRSLITSVEGFLANGVQSNDFEEESVICSSIEEIFSPSLYQRSQDHQPPSCILLRACLLVSKILSNEGNSTLQDQLNQLSGGIKIICCSKIPSGSGMGGSSILAAVILKALFHLLYPQITIQEDLLVMLVGQVEQVLTTGGGWQDQVGGIVPGFKLCQSNGTLESKITIQRCHPSTEFLNKFSQRTFLIYSGVQRLAKNTLINALQRHSHFPYESIDILSTTSGASSDGPIEISQYHSIIPNLIFNALQLASYLTSTATSSVENGDTMVDQVAHYLNIYWEQKKDLANGSETLQIHQLFQRLKQICCGCSACGAGAGGFLVCILKDGCNESELKELIDSYSSEKDMKLSIHKITIDCEDGLTVREMEREREENQT